jgi:type II secretory pathway component PulC
MAKWITKRNVSILNFVLLGVFIVTLVAVAIPFIKQEPSAPLFASDRRPTPRMTAAPKEEHTYTCQKHPDVTSTSPGKCPQCGEELKELDRYAVIVERNLFGEDVIKPAAPTPPPPPLPWQLVGVTKINLKYVAVIRDKSKNVEYTVREGEEVPGYFGVTILSITETSVRYMRAGVGEDVLNTGQPTTPGGPGPTKDQWTDVIRPVTPGHTYVVKLDELSQRIATPEAYLVSFGLEQNMDGSRVDGLKITSLPKENFLLAAGLMQGDIIKSINGSAITDMYQALAQLKTAGSGFSIELEISRGRTSRKLYYTLVKTKKGGE